ncbi:MAG: M48 family metalloprotease, partial [Nitrospiraceae bacterium]
MAMHLNRPSFSWGLVATALNCTIVLAGCSMETKQAPPRSPQPTAGQKPGLGQRQLDPQQAARLKTVMTPLLQTMDNQIPLDKVRIGIMDDPHINAANAGGGEFYVTTGLLMKANDEQLAGVMAHEVAHADLG